MTPARLFLLWYVLYEWALFIPVGYVDITVVVGLVLIARSSRYGRTYMDAKSGRQDDRFRPVGA